VSEFGDLDAGELLIDVLCVAKNETGEDGPHQPCLADGWPIVLLEIVVDDDQVAI
jgi:hypothetical protein